MTRHSKNSFTAKKTKTQVPALSFTQQPEMQERTAGLASNLHQTNPNATINTAGKSCAAYARALCQAYDYIVDLHCPSGEYQLFTDRPEERLRYIPGEKYDPALARITAAYLSAEEYLNFMRQFSQEGLEKAFASGKTIVEREYRGIIHGRTFWKKRLVLAYTHEDGSQHYLTCVSDITASKERERLRRKEAEYLFALQSLYVEIYRLDLVAGTIYAVHGDEATESAGGTIDAFFNEQGRLLVHPEHQEAFTTFYGLEQLRAFLIEGRTAEQEYRRRLQPDADYIWIAATLYPMPSGTEALLFLRDVSRIKESETHFFEALKTNFSEIFTANFNTDELHAVATDPNIRESVPLCGTMSQDVPTLAKSVHPQHQSIFLNFYEPNHLLATTRSGKRSTVEYQMRATDGSWTWVEDLVLPMPGAKPGSILILAQNISERKQTESIKLRLEQRYTAVFRQSCSLLLEVNLKTETVTQTAFQDNLTPLPAETGYSSLIENALQHVHPDDRDRVQSMRSLSALWKAYAAGDTDLECVYRMRITPDAPDVYSWVATRIFFISDESPTAFSLVRDITRQKQVEEQHQQETQRFVVALRDTGTEIYEFDPYRETSKLLFTSGHTWSVVAANGLQDNATIIATTVHPADRERIAKVLSGPRLLRCFGEEGLLEISDEFRIKSAQGHYQWVNALAVPVREEGRFTGKIMFLLRDIAQRKGQEEQQRVLKQYTLALRNIYDVFCEYNVTRNLSRVIHATGKTGLLPASARLGADLSPELAAFVHPADMDRFQMFFNLEAARKEFAEGKKCRMLECRTSATGEGFNWLSYTMFPLINEDGDEVYLLFGMNIHAHKQSEELARTNRRLEQQRIADARYRIVVEQTETLIFEWKQEDGITHTAPEITQRFTGNYDGRDVLDIWQDDGVLHPDDLPLLEAFRTDSSCQREMVVRLRLRTGGFLWCKVTVSVLQKHNGVLQHIIGTINDVDDATRTAQTLQQMAERDPLTNVYNMHTFYARAEEAMRQAPDRQFTVIRTDVDGFKVINDLYGMDEGDRLLRFLATGLQSRMTGHSVCGRIGGDVFCACVDMDEAGVLHLVQELVDSLAQYPLPNKILLYSGICRVDTLSTPMSLLCDRANLALRTVKGSAVCYHAFYDGRLRAGMLKAKRIESEMRSALSLGQFQLYLQPKVYMPDGTIVGAESLTRWHHPVDGIIPPDDFIPLFERNGFIIHLDEYMWNRTCALLRRWLDEGRPPLPCSVNVSRLHVLDARLPEKFAALIKKYDIPPHLLELELTESIFLDSKIQSLEVIDTLRGMGFHFSLDDFGAGYSSLNMLKDLQVETLKIDKGFLDVVAGTNRGKTIVSYVISLARAINMQVVAEGVENKEQASFLCQCGCTVAQGFLYSAPVPVPLFEAMLDTNNPFSI